MSKKKPILNWSALSEADAKRTGIVFGVTSIFVFLLNTFQPDLLKEPISGEFFLATLLIGYLMYALARARELADPIKKQVGRREVKQEDKKDTKPIELYAFVFTISTFLTICTLNMNGTGLEWPWTLDFSTPAGLTIFFVTLATAWAPLFYLFHLNSRRAHGNYLNHPEGPVPYQSLLLGGVIIGLIFFGARLAAKASSAEQTMGGNFGLFILALVVTLFVVFILFPHIAGWWHSWIKSKQTVDGALAQGWAALLRPNYWLSALDAVLVRIVSQVTGVTQSGEVLPKIILISVFLPLTLFAYTLPAPYGLIPVGIAGVLILSLHRRWSWVESDRDKSLRITSRSSRNFKVGFQDDDMRDEALTGYIFLFALIPLALRQIQLAYTPFEPVGADATAMGSWLKFFGTELAKGVPIVDWVDIYNVKEEPLFRVQDGNPLGLHLIFLSRLVVDFVLLAALIQAVNIWRRTEAQQKLFDEGQAELFDPFVEKRLFRQAYVPKTKRRPHKKNNKVMPIDHEFYDRLVKHQEASLLNGGPGSLYSHDRLNSMASNVSQSDIREIAEWIAEEDGVLVGPVELQLSKLLERWPAVSEGSLWTTDNSWRRKQRFALETLLVNVHEDETQYWSESMSQNLSHLLSIVAKEKDFDSVRTVAYKVLQSSTGLHAAKALAARLVRSDDATSLPFVNDADVMSYSFSRQRLQGDRFLAAEALIRFNMNFRDSRPNGNYGNTGKFLEVVFEYILKDKGERVKEVVLDSVTTRPS